MPADDHSGKWDYTLRDLTDRSNLNYNYTFSFGLIDLFSRAITQGWAGSHPNVSRGRICVDFFAAFFTGWITSPCLFLLWFAPSCHRTNNVEAVILSSAFNYSVLFATGLLCRWSTVYTAWPTNPLNRAHTRACANGTVNPAGRRYGQAFTCVSVLANAVRVGSWRVVRHGTSTAAASDCYNTVLSLSAGMASQCCALSRCGWPLESDVSTW